MMNKTDDELRSFLIGVLRGLHEAHAAPWLRQSQVIDLIDERIEEAAESLRRAPHPMGWSFSEKEREEITKIAESVLADRKEYGIDEMEEELRKVWANKDRPETTGLLWERLRQDEPEGTNAAMEWIEILGKNIRAGDFQKARNAITTIENLMRGMERQKWQSTLRTSPSS